MLQTIGEPGTPTHRRDPLSSRRDESELPQDEHTLLSGLRASDETISHTAFTKIVNLYLTVLLAFATRLLKDSDPANDIVQTVFLRLWENRATLCIRTSLRAYLMTAVRNAITDSWRAEKVAQDNLAVLALRTPATEENGGHLLMMMGEAGDCIARVLESTSPARRQAFELCFFDGMTQKAIAEILGVADSTVKEYINHVNTNIRKALAACGIVSTR